MVAAVIQISSLVGEITDINANKHCKEGLSLSLCVSLSLSLSVLLSLSSSLIHTSSLTRKRSNFSIQSSKGPF